MDTLIVRDLMVLSRERSITHAFVLSGDEDLREGVAYTQDRGVVVGLLGIRGKGGTSQSPELTREADIIDETATEASKKSLSRQEASPVIVPSKVVDFKAAVDEFTHRWIEVALAEQVSELNAGKPSIPREIDSQLLRSVSNNVLEGRLLDEEQKRTVRRMFWDSVDKGR